VTPRVGSRSPSCRPPAAIDAQRQALYNAEKAKGTNPVDIIAKMIDFTNAQSRDYLEASGWIAR